LSYHQFPPKINTTMLPQHLPHQQHHNHPPPIIMGHQHILAASPINVAPIIHTHCHFCDMSACAQAAAPPQMRHTTAITPTSGCKTHSNISKLGAHPFHCICAPATFANVSFHYYLYKHMQIK
jgi:hypothetical protein